MSGRRHPRHMLNKAEMSSESGKLYASLLSEAPRKGWWGSITIAVIFHILLFVLVIPEGEKIVEPPKKKRVVNITQPKVPPPPKRQKPQEVTKVEKKKKKLPIPDPDPEEPEPIKEPEPPDEPELELDLDFQFEEVVGVGSGGFVEGKLIESSFVKPEMPQMAKTANIREAVVEVILTIDEKGNVADVQWLNGLPIYQDAVIAAVKKWKYEPSTMDGKAVEFTTAKKFKFELN